MPDPREDPMYYAVALVLAAIVIALVVVVVGALRA